MQEKKSTIGKLTASFCRLFVNNSQMFNAVRTGTTEEVRRLIDNGIDVNTPYAGGTFLLVSANNNRFETTVLLLEQGADPTANYHFSPGQNGTIIQDTADLGDKSAVRLFAWYSADPTKVTFAKHPEFKELMEAIAKQVAQRKHFESQLLNPRLSNAAKAETCRQLASLWQRRSEGETQPVYLKHYQDKAASYLHQAQGLEGQQEVEHTHLKMD